MKDSEVVLVVSSTTELSTSIPSGPSTNYQVQWINNCWSGHGVPQAQELFGDGQVRPSEGKDGQVKPSEGEDKTLLL